MKPLHLEPLSMSTKDLLTLIVAAVGSSVALATFIRALLEFRQQGRQRRAEQFFGIGRRMEERELYERICRMLDDEVAGEPDAVKALEAVPSRDKFLFLGAFEELALVMRSRLVSPEVTHYMYGYYAIQCLRSEGFWRGRAAPAKKSSYWMLFNEFAEEMAAIERRGIASARTLRF